MVDHVIAHFTLRAAVGLYKEHLVGVIPSHRRPSLGNSWPLYAQSQPSTTDTALDTLPHQQQELVFLAVVDVLTSSVSGV